MVPQGLSRPPTKVTDGEGGPKKGERNEERKEAFFAHAAISGNGEMGEILLFPEKDLSLIALIHLLAQLSDFFKQSELSACHGQTAWSVCNFPSVDIHRMHSSIKIQASKALRPTPQKCILPLD